MTVMNEPRSIEPLDGYEISGCGRVVTVVQPDPPFDPGIDTVLFNGEERVVVGVESRAVDWGADPGQIVGLLLAEGAVTRM
jgi:hypothetical protein